MNEEILRIIDNLQKQIKETQRKAQQVSFTLTKLQGTLGTLKKRIKKINKNNGNNE